MIKIHNLKFSYHSTVPPVLDGLSFEINKGEILSVLGRNGIGKTTLLKCLVGEFLSYSGEIIIDGKEAKALSVSDRARMIALVASNNPCYQNLRVADYLVTSFANQLSTMRTPNKAQYEKAFAILSDMGQSVLFNRSIFELSSGEMQIVKIARAILQDPQIIVFDEPTSNLDIKNQLLVLKQISALSKRGYTVLTTTHNPGQSMELGGKVLMLLDHSQVFGDTTEVLTEENLCKVYGLNALLEDGRFRKYTVFEDDNHEHRLFY